MKKKQHSLSAKTINSTVISCIIFGLVIQIVALSFFCCINNQAVHSDCRYYRQTGKDVGKTQRRFNGLF